MRVERLPVTEIRCRHEGTRAARRGELVKHEESLEATAYNEDVDSDHASAPDTS